MTYSETEMRLLADLDNLKHELALARSKLSMLTQHTAQSNLRQEATVSGTMTTQQVCKELDISRAWLMALQKKGKIRPVDRVKVRVTVVREQDQWTNIYDEGDVKKLADGLVGYAKPWTYTVKEAK